MKQRIYRNYFWVALTTILIVSFVFVFSYNRTIHDQKEEGMREEAEFISALLEKQGDADIGFQAAAGKTDFRITLIAENGMVLYDNKVKDVSGMENHAKRPEILKASKNGEGSSSRISSTIQSETYYYARKLSDGRYLRLSSKGLSIWSGFVQVLPALTGIALFVIFITFLIAHFLTRNIVEAINGIDLENPMEQLVFPELGVLQKRLGFQNRKIQTQMQNMKEQEYKLTAITENMNEGLIMLDADRRIQYMFEHTPHPLFSSGEIGICRKCCHEIKDAHGIIHQHGMSVVSDQSRTELSHQGCKIRSQANRRVQHDNTHDFHDN